MATRFAATNLEESNNGGGQNLVVSGDADWFFGAAAALSPAAVRNLRPPGLSRWPATPQPLKNRAVVDGEAFNP
jgi:hypothetical protein